MNTGFAFPNAGIDQVKVHDVYVYRHSDKCTLSVTVTDKNGYIQRITV